MLEGNKAGKKLEVMRKMFKAAPSAIKKGLAGEKKRFFMPTDFRRVRKGLVTLRSALAERGEKELLGKVDEALLGIKEGNYKRFSSALDDYETLRGISSHANLPSAVERPFWEKVLEKRLGEKVELPDEFSLKNSIAGSNKGIYGSSPAMVPPVGTLKLFETENGPKVFYKSPEQIHEHERAHARFSEVLIEEGISKLLLTAKEEHALAALGEAFAILSDGSEEMLKDVRLDKPKTSNNYHRGEFYASKAAKKRLTSHFILNELRRGKKPTEIIKMIME